MIRPLFCLPLAALLLTGPTLAQDASLEKQARKLHAQAGGNWCDAPTDGFGADEDFASWTLTYQPSWSDDAPEESVTLVRLYCMSGAYNVSHNYYIETEYEGLRPLALAEPDFDVRYENDDFEGNVLGVDLTGMDATLTLVNSSFDDEAQTLTSWSKWRGLGDASSSGTWQFREGRFVLVKFEVDASYDGEVNPEVIFDHTKPGK
jgi:hypothetical protein